MLLYQSIHLVMYVNYLFQYCLFTNNFYVIATLTCFPKIVVTVLKAISKLFPGYIFWIKKSATILAGT